MNPLPRVGPATAALLAVVLVAAASPVAVGVSDTPDTVVQPDLLAAARAGGAPAILTWDRDAASHGEVADHLRRAGVEATVLEGLPAAIACAAGHSDVMAMAAAPGAVSVWGDEPLVTAFDGADAATVADRDTAAAGAELGVTGDGVGIAVVDTGLDGRHPDLADRISENVRVVISHREYLGPSDPPPCQDFYTDDLEDSELTSGHGTHLAGVAAADGSASDGTHTGIAPDADLMGVGVSYSITPDTDVRDRTRLSLLGAVAGLNYALINGLTGPVHVKVALAGWVGPGLHDPYHPIYLAIRDLHDFGISVVVPVGNEGPETSDCSTEETCLFNPFAVGPYPLGVGALDDDGALADFSSRGDPEPRENRRLTFRYEPTVVAPGTAVGTRRLGTANVTTPPGSLQAGGGSPTADQTDPFYVSMTGTSVAAGHVAGVAALIQEAARQETGCYLDSPEIREIVQQTATPMDERETWEVGAGAIDTAAAVQAAREREPDATPDPWMCPDE